MSVNVPAQLPEAQRRNSRGGPELCTISLDVEVVTTYAAVERYVALCLWIDFKLDDEKPEYACIRDRLDGKEYDEAGRKFFGNDYKPRGLVGPLMFANGAQLLAALAPQRLDMNDFGPLKGLSSARNKCEYEHGFLPKRPSQGEVERYLAKATEIIAHACGGKDALQRKLREIEFPKLPDQQSES